MSGTNSKSQEILEQLRKDIKSGKLELVIEPKLQGDPKERLAWFASLSKEQIAQCTSAEVEYFLKSAEPLPESLGDVLTANRYSYQDASGQNVYYCGINAKYIPSSAQRDSKGNNAYLDAASLTVHTFIPSQDPLFIIPDKEKRKFGIGVAKAGKEYMLVIRGSENPERILRDSGLLLDDSELLHKPSEKLWTAVTPLSGALAQSIILAHNLQKVSFKNSSSLLEACRENNALFAPASPTTAKTASAPVVVATPETANLPPDEVLLPEALKAYHATIEARRKGDGSVLYTLVMRKSADASATEDAAWKKRFPRPQDVANQINKNANLQARDAESLEMSIFLSAETARIATLTGTTLDTVPVRPFKLQATKAEGTPNIFVFEKSGPIALHLLEEDGATYLVAVDQNLKKGRDLPGIVRGFGVGFVRNLVKNQPLLTEDELAEGLTTKASYCKIPIDKLVYEDLKSDHIPVLPPAKNLVASIRLASDSDVELIKSLSSATPASDFLERQNAIIGLLQKMRSRSITFDTHPDTEPPCVTFRVSLEEQKFFEGKLHRINQRIEKVLQGEKVEAQYSEDPKVEGQKQTFKITVPLEKSLIEALSKSPPLATSPTQKDKGQKETDEKKLADRDKNLAELLLETHDDPENPMEVRVATVKEGENTSSYAYLVVNSHSKEYTKFVQNLSRTTKATGKLTPQALEGTIQASDRRSESKNNNLIVVRKLPLTPGCLAALENADSVKRGKEDYESIFLRTGSDSADPHQVFDIAVAHDWLKQFASEITTEDSVSNNPLAAQVNLTALLTPLTCYHGGGFVKKVRLEDAATLKAAIEEREERLRRWSEHDHTPPVSSRELHALAQQSANHFADPSHLVAASDTIRRSSESRERVEENIKQEIVRYKHALNIVETYAPNPPGPTELPALIIRGLNESGVKALKAAIEKPGLTAEGIEDMEKGRITGPNDITAQSSAVLRMHEIRLPGGKKRHQKAVVVLLTPALKERIEGQLKLANDGKGRLPNIIGNYEVIEDKASALNGLVTKHFFPDAELPDTIPELKRAFADLGHRAIIVRQRADTKDGAKVERIDRGAQQALYITVDAGNKAAAINMLLSLHQHDALAGEKRYRVTEKTDDASLQKPNASIDPETTLKRAIGYEYNNLFDSKSGYAKEILKALEKPTQLGSGESTDHLVAKAEAVVRILDVPRRLLQRDSLPGEEALFAEKVVDPIQSALDEVKKVKVISLLDDIIEGKKLPDIDPRIAAFRNLLDILPPTADGLFVQKATAEYAPVAFTLSGVKHVLNATDRISGPLESKVNVLCNFITKDLNGGQKFSTRVAINELLGITLPMDAKDINSASESMVSEIKKKYSGASDPLKAFLDDLETQMGDRYPLKDYYKTYTRSDPFSTNLILDDDTVTARNKLKEAFAGVNESTPPVIVHCVLNPDLAESIAAEKPPAGRYFQLARSGGSTVPFLQGQAAGILDRMVASGSGAYKQEEVLNALMGFYGIGSPSQSMGRGR